MPSSLTLTSQILGFISFAITLLTLLGVYSDLISNLRKADVSISIILANLRQEILFEKAFVSRRLRHGDEFGVFPRRLRYLKGQSEKSRRAWGTLLQATLGSCGGVSEVGEAVSYQKSH
jgi:hypothetical protein